MDEDISGKLLEKHSYTQKKLFKYYGFKYYWVREKISQQWIPTYYLQTILFNFHDNHPNWSGNTRLIITLLIFICLKNKYY
jgi:hypothetical protein